MSALAWQDGKNPEVLLVCGLGSGFLPKAPGTWGSVLGLAVWWWLLAPLPWLVQLAVAAATFAVGWWVVERVTRRYECHDDPAIVIDEIVGIWIALLGIGESWILAGLGFVLFRFPGARAVMVPRCPEASSNKTRSSAGPDPRSTIPRLRSAPTT